MIKKYLCDPSTTIKIEMESDILYSTRVDIYDQNHTVQTIPTNLYNTVGNQATLTLPSNLNISKNINLDGYNVVVFLTPLNVFNNYSLVSRTENIKNFKNIDAILKYIKDNDSLCLKTSFKDTINSNIIYYDSTNRYSYVSITNKISKNFNGLLFSLGTEQDNINYNNVPGLATEDSYDILNEQCLTSDFIIT